MQARIRKSRAEDGNRLVEIWRNAVDATHGFLTPADRLAIGMEVAEFLPRAPCWVAVDQADRPVGFMILSENHMDALFVDPTVHGSGIGRLLVDHALARHPIVTTDVNEQNGEALRFYERVGFVRTGRSPLDDQGRPYPLIHLRTN
jgi:putative acetyltransferase